MRLLLGPVALAGAFLHWPRLLFLPLLVAGTLSDIFDGILARRFGVATPALRRYDSVTDIIYYLFVLGVVWQLDGELMRQNLGAIALILLSEAGSILICFAKFRRYPATHSWLAKFYGLCLLAGLIALLAFAAGRWALISLAVVAVVTNLEIMAMHLVSPVPPVDVRSIFRLRKTKHG